MTQEKIEEGYEQGIRDMVEQEKRLGFEKTRQMQKYQGVTSLSRDQAMEIMSTIWPEAPQADKLAAAMLCATYGLNPLANHIFLIPFKDKKTGTKIWARVWGIRAKRLLATRRGTFSYLDMSPRIMTDDEQIKVWGEVDKANLCYLSHLKDMKTGAEVYGYGKWPNGVDVYGYDKGNTKANMASIRSESQAIDRLRPAEMPHGLTLIDEDYEELPQTNITFPRPESVDLTEKYRDILSTPESATDIVFDEPTTPAEPTDEDFRRLTTAMQTSGWDNAKLKLFVKGKGWTAQSMKTLSKRQIEEAIVDIYADGQSK